MSDWHIQGTYMETCSCEYLCPCIFTNMEAKPSEGRCDVAFCFMIDEGDMEGVNLNGVKAVVLMSSPSVMMEGGMTGGLIVDESASDEQVQAIAAIMSGQAGGPMAAIAPLVEEIKGIERRPIEFKQEGMRYSLKAGELLEHTLEGVASAVNENEPIKITNTIHPANHELALAKATHSNFDAFGINWQDSSGTRNGHFAPFSWSN